MITSRSCGAKTGWETYSVPSKAYQAGLSLGLSAFGSITGVKCTFTIDTGSDITIVRPDILQASGTRMEAIIGQIRTVTGEMTPLQAKRLVIELSIGNLKT